MSANEIIEVGEEASGRRVEMRVHQTLRIALSEVRTAGFRWNLRAPDEHVFSLLEDEFAPQPGAAGGTLLHHWVFRAERAGEATILLEYKRPWEHAVPPARTFSLTVRVT